MQQCCLSKYICTICKEKDHLFTSALLQIWYLLMTFFPGFLSWKIKKTQHVVARAKQKIIQRKKSLPFSDHNGSHLKQLQPQMKRTISTFSYFNIIHAGNSYVYQAKDHHNTCQQAWSISSSQQSKQDWHIPLADHQKNRYLKISHLIPQAWSSRQMSHLGWSLHPTGATCTSMQKRLNF